MTSPSPASVEPITVAGTNVGERLHQLAVRATIAESRVVELEAALKEAVTLEELQEELDLGVSLAQRLGKACTDLEASEARATAAEAERDAVAVRLERALVIGAENRARATALLETAERRYELLRDIVQECQHLAISGVTIPNIVPASIELAKGSNGSIGARAVAVKRVIHRELSDSAAPTTKAVWKIVPDQETWTVNQLLRAVTAPDKKSVYNALSYLANAGMIERMGRGLYRAASRGER